MKVHDNFTFILISELFLFCVINCQTTQCNVEEYVSVVQNLEALRAQFKELKAAMQDLNLTDIANLGARVLELQGNINNTNSEIESLKANTSAIESSIATLSGRIDSEISTLENKDSTFESSVRDLNVTLNAEVENLKSEDTNMQSSINNIKNINIVALQTRDTILQGRLDQVETDIGGLKSLTDDHTTNITILSEKGTQLESSVDSNGQAVAALNSTTTSLSSRIDVLEAGT